MRLDREGSGDQRVDPELRVRGIDRLRVADASVMPRAVMPRAIRGHTKAPTIMIAEKAADLVRARLAPSRQAERRPQARARSLERVG